MSAADDLAAARARATEALAAARAAIAAIRDAADALAKLLAETTGEADQ